MVSSDDVRTAVGIVGNAISLCLFLSPLSTFYKIWRRKSVEEFSVFPYVATLLNCMLWLLYGLPLVRPNSILVITINGTGTAIELSYVLLYLLYSAGPKRLKAALMFAGDLAFVGATAAVVLTVFHTHKDRTRVVGILCVVFNVVMYIAPLSVMIPNTLGLLFTTAQLVLYAMYYKSTKRQIAERKKMNGEVALNDVGKANASPAAGTDLA
ncbi:Bidirectional sugar transporter SWEET4 [Apostasia shenzhenica]|uniref:Bidirectional sugar transporter SWEET4 n=1 Tax=Apostasia shenzhenica TaxID=1088818 RepID=A0A2H9ZVE8_9ASPA|nr:Bidirectional sugar transporter SWEET4 [Apostasia shenzhenica]